jgi:hypothetical protein
MWHPGLDTASRISIDAGGQVQKVKNNGPEGKTEEYRLTHWKHESSRSLVIS